MELKVELQLVVNIIMNDVLDTIHDLVDSIHIFQDSIQDIMDSPEPFSWILSKITWILWPRFIQNYEISYLGVELLKKSK